jgi:hypothetical protein
MSGGQWQYVQDRLTEVYEDIEAQIENNGSQEREDWSDLKYYDFKPETLRALLLAAKLTRLAQSAIQRADWLFCCDDSEESFLRRFEEEVGSLIKLEHMLKEEEQ